MDEMIRLTIQGKPVSREAASRAIQREAPKEEFPGDAIKVTRDQSYELAMARAEGIELTTETLRANDAVSLTLTDGHVVWLPVGDLPELLQAERGQPLVINASTQLRLRTEQRGPLSIGIRILRVFGFDIQEKASESLTEWISNRVEKNVLHETKVYRCRFTRNGMAFEHESDNLIKPPSPDQPVLVLLHGTASNTAGSFSGLWTRYFGKWEEVVSHYKGHVYALEHRTLTESPASNACVLLDALAHEKQVVHLISHSRGGIVGEDGSTHHGLFDLCYLRSLPNMVVMAPKDENELRRMLLTALENDGPAALRYPRGSGTGAILENPIRPFEIGKGETVREGEDVLILAIGRSVCEALDAYSELTREGISATIVNCRFVKPLDIDLICDWARKIPRIITVEENIRQGGFGSAVLEALNDAGFSGLQLDRVGIADTFVEHGPQAVLRSKYGVDAEFIVQSAKQLMASSTRSDTQWADRQFV